MWAKGMRNMRGGGCVCMQRAFSVLHAVGKLETHLFSVRVSSICYLQG
jgi:hypothetical protein